MKDPRIDEKIADAPAFARPILTHLRKLIHQGCPEVEETLKWQMPFFVYKGKSMCHFAAFKEHCSLGFWHPEIEAALVREGRGGKIGESAGLFGRITKLADLPADDVLLRYIAEAAKFNEYGKPARPRPAGTPKRPEAAVPADLAARLAQDAKATAAFAKFSPSQRREYIEWLEEAKREETRLKRLEQTLEWVAEGKSRHWKHANC